MILENYILYIATRESIAFYDHSWNKFLSYTNFQQISSTYFNYFVKWKSTFVL